MKYFLDTEFIEGTQKKWFGETKPTIDLISIGIVCEDGREYYAISKDFNIKEAWNRYDWKRKKVNDGIAGAYKVYWIRENILKPIWVEKCKEGFSFKNSTMTPYGIKTLFTYKNFKKLINKYGKTNKQIAEEIKDFVYKSSECSNNIKLWGKQIQPEFYGYYCDYDWVVFCWLFGKMIDLPMYCIDLKQTLDSIANKMNANWFEVEQENIYGINNYKKIIEPTFEDKLKLIKQFNKYPTQTNEHNALSDAHFNYELYKFLNTL
jgi:hypothetical protein